MYYGDFLVYMRLVGFIRNEHKTEKLLLGIIENIVAAQHLGISAEDFLAKILRGDR
ncbi:hypothetical protein [Enterococcus sp. AZ191]|uniref:hypothetical protein n=1 Tax=Enterococcus sp. AZ191 TaxID=2774639 RepID=UPI003F682A2C